MKLFAAIPFVIGISIAALPTTAFTQERSARPQSIFVTETDPPFEKVDTYGVYHPPGEPMEAPPPKLQVPAAWRLRDGKVVNFAFHRWEWKTTKLEGTKLRWVVEITGWSARDSTFVKYPAETFHDAEIPRLLKLLWGQYHADLHSLRERRTKQQAGAKEAAGWEGRIAAYTGHEPRQPGEKGLPPLDFPCAQKSP